MATASILVDFFDGRMMKPIPEMHLNEQTLS